LAAVHQVVWGLTVKQGQMVIMETQMVIIESSVI